jgi:L-ascorbate metabolism protein UlaG (beta-lactamase superfamily)
MTAESKNNLMITRRQALALTGGALVASSVIGRGPSAGPGPGESAQAKLTQVRNATLRIDYGGVRFLVDPLLAEKGAYPGFEGTANSHLRNPLVALPVSLEDIINVDAVIVTHLHSDHWDDAAKARLPKSLPLFAQDESDASQLRDAGFTAVRVLTETSEFNGVKLSKTGGQHGTDAAIQAAGKVLGKVCGVVFSHPSHKPLYVAGDTIKVCGVVFSHPSHKPLYVAGDTIWNRHVEEAISRYRPEVIVLNSGDARVIGLDPIIMGTKDVLAVHQAAPTARLIASHMETVNHCVLSRAELRAFSEKEGFATSLLIPEDGEIIVI